MAGQQAGGGLLSKGQDILELFSCGVSEGLGRRGGHRREQEGVEGLTQQLLAKGPRYRVERKSCGNVHFMCTCGTG